MIRASIVYSESGLVNIYLNDRLILSEECPTAYQVLQAIAEHVPGFTLDPFIVQELHIHRLETV